MKRDDPQTILEEAMQEGRLPSFARRHYSQRLSRALLLEAMEVTELVTSRELPGQDPGDEDGR